MATNINNRLVCNEPHANLDSYYGPYNNVHAAYTALADTTVNGITYTKKYIGLTVGVWKDSSHTEITEYWFKGGLSESNLVEKTSDAGLPGGVKIVTFDKNGADGGAQNSMITDTDGKLVLPQCTLTKTGDTFSKWSYNNREYIKGDTITIGTSTVVQAVWSSSPTPKPSHKITWSAGTGINKITGTANGVGISSGESVQEGSTIVLTATPNSGYNFSQWSGLPSGTSSNNPVTFTMGTSNITVTATGSAATQYYTVSWSVGTGISSIEGVYNTDVPITPGTTEIPAGSQVILTANPQSGYQFKNWSNLPSGVDPNRNPATFLLNSNLRGISAEGEESPIVISHSLNFSCGDGVTKISGITSGGDIVESGKSYNHGTVITLTAILDDGYSSVIWEPDNIGTISGDSVEFTLDNDVDIKASGEKETEKSFYYYGCNGDTGEKWFPSVDQLRYNNKPTVVIDNSTTKYNILYVVNYVNQAPTISWQGPILTFSPINNCPYDVNRDIYIHFSEDMGWVERNGNKTAGGLAQFIQKESYVFIYIDHKGALTGKRFTISISE